jgi:NAD(P)-dependent dehydrogenase (short-subunit alcohol dehydrogenase family)
VREFATEGASVAVLDVNTVAGEYLAAELTDAGKRVAFYTVDVSDAAACARAIMEIVAQWGRVNYLVNSAQCGKFYRQRTGCHARRLEAQPGCERDRDREHGVGVLSRHESGGPRCHRQRRQYLRACRAAEPMDV